MLCMQQTDSSLSVYICAVYLLFEWEFFCGCCGWPGRCPDAVWLRDAGGLVVVWVEETGGSEFWVCWLCEGCIKRPFCPACLWWPASSRLLISSFTPVKEKAERPLNCCLTATLIQWVRKVFRPPYIFHSLLYCSHLLKSFKFILFSSLMYTQHPILTEKHNCWHFCRFIKKDKLKYHMVLSIQTLCSVFSRSTLLI